MLDVVQPSHQDSVSGKGVVHVASLPGFGQGGDVGAGNGLDVTVEGETLLVPPLHELDAVEGGGGQHYLLPRHVAMGWQRSQK